MSEHYLSIIYRRCADYGCVSVTRPAPAQLRCGINHLIDFLSLPRELKFDPSAQARGSSTQRRQKAGQFVYVVATMHVTSCSAGDNNRSGEHCWDLLFTY